MRKVGLDLGSKTLGIAISDGLGLLAHPVKTLEYYDLNKLIKELRATLNDYQYDKFILGYPTHLKGHESPMSQIVKEFKKLLEGEYKLEVILIDERLSTVEATRYLINSNMNRAKRKGMIDQMAAVIILQSYLDQKR